MGKHRKRFVDYFSTILRYLTNSKQTGVYTVKIKVEALQSVSNGQAFLRILR